VSIYAASKVQKELIRTFFKPKSYGREEEHLLAG
jgi:hypothetical protein